MDGCWRVVELLNIKNAQILPMQRPLGIHVNQAPSADFSFLLQQRGLCRQFIDMHHHFMGLMKKNVVEVIRAQPLQTISTL